MAERVGCGTPCWLWSLSVLEVVGSCPDRGISRSSSSCQDTGKVFSSKASSHVKNYAYYYYEASSHVKNYAYSSKLLLLRSVSFNRINCKKHPFLIDFTIQVLLYSEPSDQGTPQLHCNTQEASPHQLYSNTQEASPHQLHSNTQEASPHWGTFTSKMAKYAPD